MTGRKIVEKNVKVSTTSLAVVGLLAALLILGARRASADALNFPLDLNDSNTTIEFDVDSTWHLVEGRTAGVRGNLRLTNPEDPASVRGEVVIPLERFDTDNSRRDKRLREVMDATQYPEVRYSVESAELQCSEEGARFVKPCSININGRLSIRGADRPFQISAELRADGDQYELNGHGTLRWPDFGVEDPSILVARLKPEVKITVHVTWKIEPLQANYAEH